MKRLTPLAVLFILPCMQLFAQEGKLKTVQTTSVWAPANVKVDGSLKEWDDTFQAYNKTTKIFYTLCNDDKNLYFIVKSIDVQNNAKIIAGGITLVLNTEDKKKDKDAFSLTFPNIPRPTRGQGGGRGAGGGGGAPGGGRGGGGGAGGFGGGNRGQAPDSAAIAARQKQTIEAAKEIKVLGFKDVTDTLISIYNEFSIKAAISYDKLGNYDYEMAIPLKELNLTPGDAKEIAYHITVNGLQMPANFQDRQGGQGGAGAADAVAGGGGAAGGRGGAAPAGGGAGGRGGRGGAPGAPQGGAGQQNRGPDPDMFSPTDFWGKYTLAKK
jgi:hypothetical protein